jgi:prolipoprotein diacylglyceryltransferase
MFLTTTAVVLAILLFWGVKNLPGERWQMLAIVPGKKQDGKHWQGTTLTYSGFFIATSQLLALALLLALLGAMDISLPGTALAAGLLLTVCVPAARLVAILVEKKRHTFTIGGASFVGILLAPFSIYYADGILDGFTHCYLPFMPVMSAMAVAYTLGEGLGRLGCLSYGCCYGKPLRDCSPFVQRLFAKTGTIFYGNTKKAEYESRLSGERLVPVQAITCLLFTMTALAGSWLFLKGHFTATLLTCISVTQIWRLLSETLRADFRGFGKISSYQKMGAVAVLYTCGIAYFTQPENFPQPAIIKGIAQLWQPGVIVCLQLTWLLFFIYFGRSTVTSSTISFSLREERI